MNDYMRALHQRLFKSVLGKTQAEVKGRLTAKIEECKQLDFTRSDEYTVETWLQT